MSVPTRVVFGGVLDVWSQASPLPLQLPGQQKSVWNFRSETTPGKTNECPLVSSSNHQFSGDVLLFRVVRCYFLKCPIKKQPQNACQRPCELRRFSSQQMNPILWKPGWLIDVLNLNDEHMSNWFGCLSSGWLKDQTSHIGRFHDPIHLRVGFTSFLIIITTQNNKHWYFFDISDNISIISKGSD